MVRGKDNPHRPAWLIVRIVAVSLAMNIASHAVAADFAKGVAAYDTKDYQTAFKEWLPLAEDGDPAAQRNIGHLYRRGLGVEQDQALAIKWYREAAERGFDRAQANLAYMYLQGDGVDRDFEQAAEWFYRAAIQGHPIAQFNLGQMYQLGWGVPKDLGRAIAWYNLSAKAGHQKALDRLSVLILRSGPPELEQDGGESLPAGMPEGEPGWEEEPVRVADTAPKTEKSEAAAPTVKTAAAAAETPNPIPDQARETSEAPVPRIQEPLPKDKQVTVASLAAPTAEPIKPAAETAPEEKPADAPEPTTATTNEVAETSEVAEEDDDGGFFSRFFSLKARDDAPANAATRQSQLNTTLANSPAHDEEPDGAAASRPAEVSAPSTETSEQSTPDQKAIPADEDAEVAVAAEETSAPAPAQPARPSVDPDTPPAAAKAPEVADTDQTEEPPAAPARPEIKVTVINPPLEEEVAATPGPPESPEKEEKGFFARLFGGSSSETEVEQTVTESDETPVQPEEPVTDLTALPKATDTTDAATTDLAPKVKEVEITTLAPPPADKISPNSAANTDQPVQAVIRQPAPVTDPLPPIPEPATGPTEQETRYVVARKTASAGPPRQRADDNPQEFFAPKVTIDWNTVLKPSASYSPPAPVEKVGKTGEGKKPASLADSDQATLTALAAQQGLIEPLQLGLLAYRSKDYKTAIKYWLPMAHSGKSRAQFYMGGLYHDGTGVEQDKIQAFVWWSLAAAKGYNPALTARERLRDRMSEVEVAEAMNLIRTWRPVDE